jgi:hypothetical protein
MTWTEHVLPVTLTADPRDGAVVRTIDFSSVEPYKAFTVLECSDTEARCRIGKE